MEQSQPAPAPDLQDIPADFLAVFVENGLDIPPLPRLDLEGLYQTDDSLFSADLSETAANFAGNDNFIAAPADWLPLDEEGPCFSCGVTGYGLQNRMFRYLLSIPPLELLLEESFGRAYADADEQAESMSAAYLLIQSCLLAAESEALRQGPLSGRLFVRHDRLGCRFCLVSPQGETLREGDSPADLMALLASLLLSAPQPGARNDWMQV